MTPNLEHDLAEVRNAIDTCPIIDNHAHNLLRADKQDRYSLISGVAEARGDALKDTPRSLAHLRAVKQLRELYDCPPNATWEDLLKKRESLDHHELVRRCLQGTHTILIDDGLDDTFSIHPVKWHDQFTTGRNRRIVRIETLASDIMKVMWEEGEAPLRELGDAFDLTNVWPVFLQAFENAMADELKDELVVGFKSVVCYRTGLDVAVGDELAITMAGQEAFRKYIRGCARGNYRVQHKGLNDCLVTSACKLITAHHRHSGVSKPLQFHTGLGDNDINLLRSNPAHLQPLIARFPHVQFILLHSSYPYTREAGYLATVYTNAWLDVGEIFPMVSIEGQVAAIKQSMELTPFSKLLWSTDGHHFPETYWLANKQFRHVLYRVFRDLLAEDVLSKEDAIQAVRDIIFNNSNRLYHLKIPQGDLTSQQSGEQKPLAILPASTSSAVPAVSKKSAPPQPIYDSRILSHYLRTSYGKATTYFILQWVDYLGTMRSRSLPYSSFRRLIGKGNRLGVTHGNLHVLQDDSISPAVNATGQIYIEPDLTTIRPIHYKELPGAATVMSSYRSQTGAPLPACPRSRLQLLSDRLADTHSLHILVGFELEVTLLRQTTSGSDPTTSTFQPIESNAAHAWGSLTAAQASTTWPLITKIVDELSQVGIPIEHFHSESGQGQYEFALSPLPLVVAVDTLYQARQAIQLKAARHGYRATFHPNPVGQVGSGLHAHLSLNRNNPTQGVQNAGAERKKPKLEDSFWAGVLAELRAICAFSLPNEDSYKRVKDDAWTGGTWVAWGTENRETPIRRVVGCAPNANGDEEELAGHGANDGEAAAGASVEAAGEIEGGAAPAPAPAQATAEGVVGADGSERWEIRCMDGMANAYFALSAVVGAGLDGLDKGLEMVIRDCELNPARMTDEQGAEYGITEKMPLNLGESLTALEESSVLKQVLGADVVRDYVIVKKAEQEKLAAMEDEQRRTWLLERY